MHHLILSRLAMPGAHLLCSIRPLAKAMVGFLPMLLMLVVLPSLIAAAVTCTDLDSEKKLRGLLARVRAANPIAQERLSVYLEVSPCEGETCAVEQRRKRVALLQQLHLLRRGDDLRLHVSRGPQAGQCMINRAERDYVCTRCDGTSNADCRSVVRSSGSTRIPGTNLDQHDFDVLGSGDYTSTCQAEDAQPGFLTITSTRSKGEHPYERVVTLLDGDREVPVTVNYFAAGTLRKVYRFFPKYYVKIDGAWVATIVRVRSTEGSEKQYVFETQLRVLTGDDGQPLLFRDLGQDARLKGYDLSTLFFAN